MSRILVKRKNPGFSTALLAAFLTAVFALVCLSGAFDFLDGIKDALLGIFGLAAYAYGVFVVLAAPALFFGYRIVVRPLTVTKFAAFFFVFLFFLHALTSDTLIRGASFAEYCNACFSGANTAGGLLVAVLNYPVHSPLGVISAAAIYGALAAGLLLWIILPYLKAGHKNTASDSPALTDFKDGVVNVRPIVKTEAPRPAIHMPSERLRQADKDAAPSQRQKKPVFDIRYDAVQSAEDRRRRAMTLLYENSKKTILVDNTPGYEVMAVKKKEEKDITEEFKDDLDNYTNNGRLKTLVENRKNSFGSFDGYGGTLSEAAEPQPSRAGANYANNAPYDAGYGAVRGDAAKNKQDYGDQASEPPERYDAERGDGETFSEDVYENYNIMRSGDSRRSPSMLGNNIEEVREQLRREMLREKAERDEAERQRLGDERENRRLDYRSARKIGFVDDDISDDRIFVNMNTDRDEETQRKKPQRTRTRGANSSADRVSNPYTVPQKENDEDEAIERLRSQGQGKPAPAARNDGDTEAGSTRDSERRIRAAALGPESAFDRSGQDGFGAARRQAMDNPYGQPSSEDAEKQGRPDFKIIQKPVKRADEQITFDKFEPIRRSPYKQPPIDLLLDYPNEGSEDAAEIENNVRKLEEFFTDFKISAVSCGALTGPTFTRYELKMPPGISVNRVVSLDNDISMRLATKNKVRIEAPIPGKDAFGIELPNKKRSTVGMRDLVNDREFTDGGGSLLFTLGKDISGRNYYGELSEMPHLLIAGSTGSGKSCCLNSFIISLLYKYEPDEVRLILIDPKQVELSMYEGLPHLLLHDIITEDEKVINALDWAIKEMHRRYGLIKASRSNKIDEYNKKVPKNQRMYRIVIIVDEVAELMTKLKRELEDRIKSLSQLARAAGIHVVLATQRPSVDIITGVIKSNMPSRIAFAVTSAVDSRTILDRMGAEKLLGKGDMLYQAQVMPEPIRLQGVFISNQEILKVVDYVRQNNESYYDAVIDAEINTVKEQEPQSSIGEDEDGFVLDPLFVKAAMLVIENNAASISMLQRKFAIGYTRAARIIDIMEDRRIIGKADGAKPRSVLITREEFYSQYGDLIEE